MNLLRDSHSRSIAKAVTWRLFGTLATSALVFMFTRRLALSLSVGAVEFVSKVGLFWLHERIWARLTYGRKEPLPSVIWFTGLSGAGKSAISERVTEELRARGLKVEHLDGDSMRSILPATGFTRAERDAHVHRVGFLASRLERHGVFVVASFVSPYRESREFVRRLATSFIEVYVSTPLEECERRDVKGLYAKARSGEVAHFTGISDPYEPPTGAEIVIDSSLVPLEDAVSGVLRVLHQRMERSDGSPRSARVSQRPRPA